MTTELPFDQSIIMGDSKEEPVDSAALINEWEGQRPTESESFKTVEKVWLKTQFMIEGPAGRDIDGNSVVPALYQEVVWNQPNSDPQRMLVMNAGHYELARKKDKYENDATDGAENPLYTIQIKLPVAKSDGSVGYMIVTTDIAYNDTSRDLERFMQDEVPVRCAQRLRQHFDVLAKKAQHLVDFGSSPSRDGRYLPTRLTGFSYQPVDASKTKEWLSTAKSVRQMFDTAVDRNIVRNNQARADREARQANDNVSALLARAAEHDRLNESQISEDDL